MKSISIILLLSFTAYAAQDSINVFLASHLEDSVRVEMADCKLISADIDRQMIGFPNIPEKIDYLPPYIIEGTLVVKGTSVNNGLGSQADHENAILDAKRNALLYLNINAEDLSDEGVHTLVLDIFNDRYSIARRGYNSKGGYEVLLHGKLNMQKVHQYALEMTPRQQLARINMIIVGIAGIAVAIGAWKFLEESIEWK